MNEKKLKKIRDYDNYRKVDLDEFNKSFLIYVLQNLPHNLGNELLHKFMQEYEIVPNIK